MTERKLIVNIADIPNIAYIYNKYVKHSVASQIELNITFFENVI